MNFEVVKENLTHQDIIRLIQYFFPGFDDYVETDSYLILPTVCHNLDINEASKKLYYYDNTKLFFCYTHCDSSFDIFDLIQKMLKLRDLPSELSDVFRIINSNCNLELNGFVEKADYKKLLEKYQKNNYKPEFKVYPEKLLNLFEDYPPLIWYNEGISFNSMKKYGIKVSGPKEQIIIPHRDMGGRLIGIRSRNLDPELIAKGNKYMPTKIEDNYYAHPLMYNLYGIDKNWKAIQDFKTAWIMEGEKSVMKCDTWYGENNLAVASCGDKVNKFQIDLLIKLGVQNVVICYDRMNFDNESDEIYFNKLYKMCLKYSPYMNMSFIFDRKRILNYKDAPVDSGKEIFEKLLGDRVFV